MTSLRDYHLDRILKLKKKLLSQGMTQEEWENLLREYNIVEIDYGYIGYKGRPFNVADLLFEEN